MRYLNWKLDNEISSDTKEVKNPKQKMMIKKEIRVSVKIHLLSASSHSTQGQTIFKGKSRSQKDVKWAEL